MAILIDFDGTLAKYDGWRPDGGLGDPIPAMVDRVKGWLECGKDVKVFTARMSVPDDTERESQRDAIQRWCESHLGRKLEVTCCKTFADTEIWDDRCVQVITNTGMTVREATEAAAASAKDCTYKVPADGTSERVVSGFAMSPECYAADKDGKALKVVVTCESSQPLTMGEGEMG